MDSRGSLGEAEKLCERAAGSWDPEERVALARRAPEVSERCADAWLILARDEAATPEAAKGHHERAVEAGERALGPGRMMEAAGESCSVPEARPYPRRAREGLVPILYELGQTGAAVSHAYEMPGLDEADHRGMRHPLLAWLLEAERDDEASELVDPTPEYGGEILSRYDVEFARGGAGDRRGELRTVGRPRPFETSRAPAEPQPRLFGLEYAGWPKELGLEGYAPRRPQGPTALRRPLFSYAEDP